MVHRQGEQEMGNCLRRGWCEGGNKEVTFTFTIPVIIDCSGLKPKVKTGNQVEEESQGKKIDTKQKSAQGQTGVLAWWTLSGHQIPMQWRTAISIFCEYPSCSRSDPFGQPPPLTEHWERMGSRHGTLWKDGSSDAPGISSAVTGLHWSSISLFPSLSFHSWFQANFLIHILLELPPQSPLPRGLICKTEGFPYDAGYDYHVNNLRGWVLGVEWELMKLCLEELWHRITGKH